MENGSAKKTALATSTGLAYALQDALVALTPSGRQSLTFESDRASGESPTEDISSNKTHTQERSLNLGDDSGFDEARAELFEALGHQTRIRILQELGRKTMGFSELKRNVDLESSGLLSFHLRKLTHLVKATSSGDYTLTDEGREALGVIGTVRSQGSNGGIKHAKSGKNIRIVAAASIAIALVILAGFISYYNSSNLSMSEQERRVSSLSGQLAGAICHLSSVPSVELRGLNNPPSFEVPFLAIDPSGNPWISDPGSRNGTGSVWEMARPLTFQGTPAAFLLNGSVSDANTFRTPFGITFDSMGNLWVADWGQQSGDRILEFKSPLVQGAKASLIIGPFSSIDFRGLLGMSFDPRGYLWVVDGGNNRILEFAPPFARGMYPSVIVGQPNLTTFLGATTAHGLNDPWGVAFDPAGNLFVSDRGNHRVLEFRFPFKTGMNASIVLGQSNFTSLEPGTTLLLPSGLAFDSWGNLWVSSWNGVVEFTPPFSNGMSSTTEIANVYALGMAFDRTGDLWSLVVATTTSPPAQIVEYPCTR